MVHVCSHTVYSGTAIFLEVGSRLSTKRSEMVIIIWLRMTSFFDRCKGSRIVNFELLNARLV